MKQGRPGQRPDTGSGVWIVILLTVLAVSGAADTAGAGCVPGNLAIAVDAGHGPQKPGATSATGVDEYAFNTRLAETVVKALATAGFPRAFLLDPTGRDLPPAARAKQANTARAGLLLSIHHDAVQSQFLETRTVNGKTNRFCDRYAGYSLFYSGKNPRETASLALARRIGEELRAAGLAFTRHHAADIPGERRELVDDTVGVYRYDGLAVLRAADMPAVLLEAGIIVNREEETVLATPERRQTTAAAVARAVASWCAATGH